MSVSFFLRTSSQYDTLMQMGRWFGYREGFEDLARVWVEDRVKDAFYDLATVEAEIRRDIDRYAKEEITPEQFAVRIRKIPGMTITAPAKMRHAIPVQIGYAGTHVQTFRFYRNSEEKLEANWKAGASLIDAITSDAEHVGHSRILREVPAVLISKFLRDYKAHETHRNLAPKFLASFVDMAAATDKRVASWSVVVIGAGPGLSKETLGKLGQVPTVVRSAEANSGEDASIKALMSRRDIILDLKDATNIPDDASWDDLKKLRETRQANAVLLLYPIEAHSVPKRSVLGARNPREPLNAVLDVLGFGLVFPGDKQLSGTYVAANLSPDVEEAADELDEGDKIPDAILDAATTTEVA